MRIGGGGREQWMVLLPLCVAVGILTVFLGGPDEALTTMEHLAYDAWDFLSTYLRR